MSGRMNVCVQKKKKTCRRIFIAAQFVMASNWKQSKYPSTGKWTNKL
jgi:hypothetical protein